MHNSLSGAGLAIAVTALSATSWTHAAETTGVSPIPRAQAADTPATKPSEGTRRDECADPAARPQITLTLEPAQVKPGTRVTLRWAVRHAGAPVWPHAIQLRSDFGAMPAADPVPLAGSYVYLTTMRDPRTGSFTLTTRCGQKTVSYRRID